MAAAQAQLCRAIDTDSGGGGGKSASDGDSDAMAVASALPLCLFHDLVGVAVFLASHPVHAVYLLIFARGLASLAAFFWPLLASTSLLLAVLATAGPYVGGGAEWPGVRSLGRTCGIAVAALCAGLRPDGAGAGAGLVGQLCSFVLGPTDAASVLRVEEIMGEPCDTTAVCFVLDEDKSLLLLGGDGCKELSFEVPTMGSAIGERSFLDYDDFGDLKDEIDDKVVISEDLKVSNSLAEQCCPRDTLFVQEIEVGEEEENDIQGQGLILSAIDEVSDDVEEKRLECDPVSVEIKKSDPVQALEIKKLEPVEPVVAKILEIKKPEPAHEVEIKKCEPMQPMQIKKSERVESVETKKSGPAESVETKNSKLVQALEIKKCEPVQVLEVKKFEPVEPLEIRKSKPVEPVEIKKREQVKPRSSIAQRIKLWEAQVSGNIKPVLEDKEESSVEFSLEKAPIKDAKQCVRFEADPCVDKRDNEHQDQEVASSEESPNEQQEQEVKDVKEYTRSETETSSEKCSQNIEAAQAVAQAEEELQQDCKDAQPEPELQEQAHKIEQPEQELQEMEEEVYTDVTASPAMWNGRESPLKSTSIAGRVHSRTSSENLVSEGSPSWKDKEWKRTLACKLYEERMQLRLCRDRAVVEGSDNMDMLWEAYEVGGGGGGGKGRAGKRSGSKAKGGADNKVEEVVDEGEEEGQEDDDEEEGSVRQLCCLQALKFSTRKMNFGGGKPSLSKISKVLRRMTALSRMGSRRKQSG
ncbi:DNA ligase 1 [Panicum miliaceum]|uniref:DNA ligase 1 n=1 Tax=Panicum miliaceum TaxID=4540 RepID=A0A3L6Q462_PANMI|nr:DNA ligase 1 [Panicum miliaceum]